MVVGSVRSFSAIDYKEQALNRSINVFVLLICCLGIFTGCATTAQIIPLVHKPVANAAGGTGELFLSINGGQWYEPQDIRSSRFMRRLAPITNRSRIKKDLPQEITLVNVKNNTGRAIGKYVMPVYSGDMIIDSLKKELTAAGYTVRLVRKLPKNTGNGIDISWISADLEQRSGLLTLEGTCNLQTKVDLWRNGTKVDTHDYVSKVSDFSFMHQDLLLEELIMKASQSIAKQSIHDIINANSRNLH